MVKLFLLELLILIEQKLHVSFFHPVIEGFYETDFNHNIFNADPTQIFF